MSNVRLMMVPCILLILAVPATAAFGAELGSQAGVQLGTVPASPFAPAAECQTNASRLATPLLQPRAKSLTVGVCGGCSVPVCAGAIEWTSICGQDMSGNIYKCLPAYGNQCSDLTDQCQCWTGPLP